MSHDAVHHPGAAVDVNNVLASIRRLIALDSAVPHETNSRIPAVENARSAAFSPSSLQAEPDAEPRLKLASISAKRNGAPSPDRQGGETASSDMRSARLDLPATPRAEEFHDLPLSPEDEAELLEAEAALARMIGQSRADPAPTVDRRELSQLDQGSAPPDVDRAPPPLTPDLAEAGLVNLFTAAGPATLDLRHLVREAVRHELTGDMGDILSRNLRRLVRQEIEEVVRDLCAEDRAEL
ncbi:hypothetical protein RGQ15_03765 [Paracoccus sp. MBLB3053]|uniref:DUF2497 domain-containing protein n=1 Tax=Paracoccus aurantius TaxID=3073814 RepID=A0ABU2HNT5_9RHOB|nr:hypothetical protein [Paracoccus sp. MBLB3053]MDS9466698.1 hypothetical protein [Paracoccus sp. MBLB3053]